jgi:hypothetical protein
MAYMCQSPRQYFAEFYFFWQFLDYICNRRLSNTSNTSVDEIKKDQRPCEWSGPGLVVGHSQSILFIFRIRQKGGRRGKPNSRHQGSATEVD